MWIKDSSVNPHDVFHIISKLLQYTEYDVKIQEK